MKVSEIEGLEDLDLCFIKFSNESRDMESLRDGTLYMNNLRYFVELEKKTGIKGMGDMLEASNVVNNVNLKFYHHGTDILTFEADAKSVQVRLEEALDKPVFCLMSVKSDMFEVINENENSVDAKLVFTDEQRDKIVREFGKYALVFPWYPFTDKVFSALQAKGYRAVGDFVRYSDFGINHSERMESFNKQDAEMFFWKDTEFTYQREFRIVVLNSNVNSPLVLEFESIRDSSLLITTEDLLSGSYGINIKSKPRERD